MRIVSLCGSPGLASANRAALHHAEAHLTNSGVECVEASLEGVPVFDPRLADQPPASVIEISSVLSEADGVMIAAPEYAGGLSGGTKTALDWMVGLSSFYHRRVAVLSAGTTGGAFAIEQLVRTLSWQGGLVVDTLGIEAPRTKIDASGNVFDLDLCSAIEQWADSLVAGIRADGHDLLAMVETVVAPLAIDVARFGDVHRSQQEDQES